ncbi:hypothetical protein HK102_007145 [Quaeritorhiza haematococci]|nr:hypothetical protein HK102_007145 [Quaeritorhiza haematococci]
MNGTLKRQKQRIPPSSSLPDETKSSTSTSTSTPTLSSKVITGPMGFLAPGGTLRSRRPSAPTINNAGYPSYPTLAMDRMRRPSAPDFNINNVNRSPTPPPRLQSRMEPIHTTMGRTHNRSKSEVTGELGVPAPRVYKQSATPEPGFERNHRYYEQQQEQQQQQAQQQPQQPQPQQQQSPHLTADTRSTIPDTPAPSSNQIHIKPRKSSLAIGMRSRSEHEIALAKVRSQYTFSRSSSDPGLSGPGGSSDDGSDSLEDEVYGVNFEQEADVVEADSWRDGGSFMGSDMQILKGRHYHDGHVHEQSLEPVPTPPLESVTCPLCHDVFSRACRVSCCSKVACFGCIGAAVNMRWACPLCGDPNFTPEKVRPDVIVQSRVEGLTVRCKQCLWEGSRKDVMGHFQSIHNRSDGETLRTVLGSDSVGRGVTENSASIQTTTYSASGNPHLVVPRRASSSGRLGSSPPVPTLDIQAANGVKAKPIHASPSRAYTKKTTSFIMKVLDPLSPSEEAWATKLVKHAFSSATEALRGLPASPLSPIKHTLPSSPLQRVQS